MKRRDRCLKEALAEMQCRRPDLKKVFDLLTDSAKNNHPEALYALGSWYLHGRHVRKNLSTAIDYLKRSAELHYPAAWYDLAICYEKANGVKRSHKQAFTCYLKAALLGDKQSIYEVGRCYYYGIGVAINKGIGRIWLDNAELHGIE